MIWLARFWSWRRLPLLAWGPPECIYQKFAGLWGCDWMADGIFSLDRYVSALPWLRPFSGVPRSPLCLALGLR
jgi:hypothetical protein